MKDKNLRKALGVYSSWKDKCDSIKERHLLNIHKKTDKLEQTLSLILNHLNLKILPTSEVQKYKLVPKINKRVNK